MNRTDPILAGIADYVAGYEVTSEVALGTATLCLADSLGCAIRALAYSWLATSIPRTCLLT